MTAYIAGLEKEGYRPPAGLAQGLNRLSLLTGGPRHAVQLLDEANALLPESPQLLAPGVEPEMLGSQNLDFVEGAADRYQFIQLLAAVGLFTDPEPPDSNFWVAARAAERLGWTHGRLLGWLRERGWVSIEPNDNEHWGPSHVAVFARGHLDELEEFVDSYVTEHATPINVVKTAIGFALRLPLSPAGKPIQIGQVFRPSNDGRLEEIEVSEGVINIPEAPDLVFTPRRLGDHGDPLRGAPPDLFTTIESTNLYPLRDRDLVALRHLSDVRELHIGWSIGFGPESGRFAGMGDPQPITDAAFDAIAGFSRLSSLAISSKKISDEGLDRLPRLDLSRIGLRHAAISGETLGGLVGPTTNEVTLEFTTIPVGSCDWLREASGLERLRLKGVGLDDAALPELGYLPLLHLDLSCNAPSKGSHWQPGSVGDRAVELAADISVLESLWAMYAEISDAGLLALTGHPSIEELGLWGTAITDRGMAHIARIPQLRHLELNSTSVSDRGVSDLEGTSLTRLSLSGTEVTARCLDSILTMEHLKELNLTDASIPVEKLKQLRALPRLSRLELYHIFDCDIHDKLSAWLPGVTVEINPY